MHDKVKIHEVQLQILVDAIQDIKEKKDQMFERRERTILEKDGFGEDFQEDPGRGKEKQKTPLEVKHQSKDSKGSNLDSEEVFTLTKKEMSEDVQRIIADAGSIIGCTVIRGNLIRSGWNTNLILGFQKARPPNL